MFDLFEKREYKMVRCSMLVNSCKFTEPELAVRWLIRGMPLVHPDARLLSFKSLHPYCALSADLYRSWPRAKQVANEVNTCFTIISSSQKNCHNGYKNRKALQPYERNVTLTGDMIRTITKDGGVETHYMSPLSPQAPFHVRGSITTSLK